MNGTRRVIWFWQRIVSPHMAGLATALARQGCEVTYVAEQVMSADRARQGWAPPDLNPARQEVAATASAIEALVNAAPPDSIHICQGIRSNGLVGKAQIVLAKRGLRQWVVMETVEDSGWRGVLKRLEYRRLFGRWRGQIHGVLATGHHTPEWVIARGMPAEQVFPFAYFLPEQASSISGVSDKARRFRFVFVGQFVERKRLDLLIAALGKLQRTDVELTLIGSGPLEFELRAAAEAVLPGRVNWIGQLPVEKVPQVMATADCLVLPSRHDGWGAVVSEALMVGTPAICSDRCGSAGVVRASGHGGVFRSGDVSSLVVELERVLANGRLSDFERLSLAEWARCLGADAGASYLQRVLDYADDRLNRPIPPWETVF